MCLAVPGRITEIINDHGDDHDSPLTRRGVVDFGGVRKEVNLALLPEAEVGDHVLVHVGFAMSRIDAHEAERVFSYLSEIGAVEDG
jgi:hydrogenase expression/formation protein HypC